MPHDDLVLPAAIGESDNRRFVTLRAGDARAIVHEHGAHVTAWDPGDGHGEALFLSRRAKFDGASAIRGGVPVIFPQFGPGPLPKHGFARVRRWTITDAGERDDGAATARLALADDEATRALWPHPFAAEVTVALTPRTLAIALAVTNTGDAPFEFTALLHSYLRVADVTSARVHGLAGAVVRDKLTRVETTEREEPLTITGEIDRVYVDVRDAVHVHDPIAGRTTHVRRDGLPDVVVWNPWEEGARAFDDMDDEEWREMLCVEPGAVAEPVTLAPGATWRAEQVLEVG